MGGDGGWFCVPALGGEQGRHKGEECVPQSCLSEIDSGTGETWLGEARSNGHLSPI